MSGFYQESARRPDAGDEDAEASCRVRSGNVRRDFARSLEMTLDIYARANRPPREKQERPGRAAIVEVPYVASDLVVVGSDDLRERHRRRPSRHLRTPEVEGKNLGRVRSAESKIGWTRPRVPTTTLGLATSLETLRGATDAL